MIACTQEHHPNRPTNIARTAVTQRSRPDDHFDMHHMHGADVDEHSIEVGSTHRTRCTPETQARSRAWTRLRTPGHPARRPSRLSGEWTLHHPHGDRCDDHGRVQGAQPRAAMGQTKRVRSCGRLT